MDIILCNICSSPPLPSAPLPSPPLPSPPLPSPALPCLPLPSPLLARRLTVPPKWFLFVCLNPATLSSFTIFKGD